MAGIVPSRRVRGTPFSAGVQAAGAKAYTVYNHMLLPSYFESYQADYLHLKNLKIKRLLYQPEQLMIEKLT